MALATRLITLNDKSMRVQMTIAAVGLLVFLACQREKPTDPAYLKDWSEWHAERVAELKAPDGWLALVGLYWLKEGTNTFGSAPENDVLFPVVAPGKMGRFVLEGDSVRMEVLPGTNVHEKDSSASVREAVLKLADGVPPVVYSWGSLDWVLLERGGKYGIRLWDRNSVNIAKMDSIPHYPLDLGWKLEATLIPADSGRTVRMQNVLGMTMEQASAGTLEFQIEGKTFQLEALEEPGGYFLIFADETSGEETYSGGRYLSAPKADAGGKTVIDFNKAYNPPCAFTKYATCLLPPAGNRLPLAIRAGERDYGHH
jgi:uncharacterized protein (DUF1684 family)